MLKNKCIIRKEILGRRDSLDAKLKRAKDAGIRERLTALPEFIEAYKILLYASFRSEVDTFDLIKYCIAVGKIVVLPKVNREKEELMLYEVKGIEELVPGYFGVPEPKASEARRMNVSEMDMLIIPGVAFDEMCGRMGYGKGFYDKLLAKGNELKNKEAVSRRPTTFAVGLAYEEQIVERLPMEAHDIRMDKIITDKRIITCND